MYFLSYRAILLDYANRSELTSDEYNDIVSNIENSPILRLSLHIHPIEKFNKLMRRTQEKLRFPVAQQVANQRQQPRVPQEMANVHSTSFAGSRADVKERLKTQEFYRRYPEHSREDYQKQLLQLLQDSESYLLSLPDSMKEGPGGEADGIIADFPEYAQLIFHKYAAGATGEEFLFSALKRILLSSSSDKDGAEKLLFMF